MQHGIVGRMLCAVLLQQIKRIVKRDPLADSEGQLPFPFQIFVDQKIFPIRIVLDRRDAPARSFGQRQLNAVTAQRQRWPWSFRFQHSSRGFAHDAGGVAIRIAIDLASGRIGYLGKHSRCLQRGGIGYRDVAVDAREHGRMIAGYRIDVLARRQLSARPERVVPSAADDPIAGRNGLGIFGDALPHLGQRLHADKIHLQHLAPAVRQMHMRVVEAGHDEVPAQINHLRMVPLQLADIVVGTDGDDAACADRYCLRARRNRFGVDVAVDED